MMSQPNGDWFVVRRVTRDTYAVCEPGHVNSFLLVGTERAVLIDTGLGVAPIRPIVEALSDRPVTVVNTHSPPDHVAGNHEFEQIAIHPAGRAALENQPFSEEDYRGYMDYAERMLGAAGGFEAADREYFQLFDSEARPRPFPPGFDPASWTVRPSRATEELSDGDRIDLGDRSLTVIATPGHSPDGICLLDERDGVLVEGDTLGTGPLYAQFPDSDLEAFARSSARLRELKDDVRLVLIAHFNRSTADPELIEEIAAGFERVRAGEVPLAPSTDLTGAPVSEARFARFSILLPPNHRS